jgi:hypothetical protein
MGNGENRKSPEMKTFKEGLEKSRSWSQYVPPKRW